MLESDLHQIVGWGCVGFELEEKTVAEHVALQFSLSELVRSKPIINILYFCLY